jgi:plasmid stabilization system protein ParE
MKVILLPNALKRLEEIYMFLQTFNPNTAVRIYNNILDEIEILEKYPRISAIEPLLSNSGKEFRSLIIMKYYKIIYYVEDKDNTVYVATVWDSRQNPDNLETEILIAKLS